jgi:hypothetical protein
MSKQFSRRIHSKEVSKPTLIILSLSFLTPTYSSMTCQNKVLTMKSDFMTRYTDIGPAALASFTTDDGGGYNGRMCRHNFGTSSGVVSALPSNLHSLERFAPSQYAFWLFDFIDRLENNAESLRGQTTLLDAIISKDTVRQRLMRDLKQYGTSQSGTAFHIIASCMFAGDNSLPVLTKSRLDYLIRQYGTVTPTKMIGIDSKGSPSISHYLKKLEPLADSQLSLFDLFMKGPTYPQTIELLATDLSMLPVSLMRLESPELYNDFINRLTPNDMPLKTSWLSKMGSLNTAMDMSTLVGNTRNPGRESDLKELTNKLGFPGSNTGMYAEQSLDTFMGKIISPIGNSQVSPSKEWRCLQFIDNWLDGKQIEDTLRQKILKLTFFLSFVKDSANSAKKPICFVFSINNILTPVQRYIEGKTKDELITMNKVSYSTCMA